MSTKMKLTILCTLGVLYAALTIPVRALGRESPAQCVEDEPGLRKACFVDRSLSLAAMPKNLDVVHPLYTMLESTFTLMDPTVYCSDLEKYEEAAHCAINITKACYDADGTRNVIMNADDVIAGMRVLCDKRQELDMECFKNFYVMVEECTKYHRRASNTPDSSETVDIICAKDDLEYDCMDSIMTAMCGGNTTRVFLEQMDQYTITPACKQNKRPSRPRARYFQVLRCPDSGDKNDGDGSKGTASCLTTALLCLASLLCVAIASPFGV